VTDPRHHFCDFGPVRLVRRTVEQQGHRSDQAFIVKGAQNDPLAPSGGGQRALPEGVSHL
jgi:hypothetical protein